MVTAVIANERGYAVSAYDRVTTPQRRKARIYETRDLLVLDDDGDDG